MRDERAHPRAGKEPRPLEEPRPTGDARLDALARVLAVVDRLRAPDGCPWDLEQSVRSMAPSLIEEAREALEAIERGDDRGTVEELGDLLMVLLLIGKIAEQDGRFGQADAARAVADKLVRRHPHVFGEIQVEGASHAIANWEKIKQAERKADLADASAVAGVPLALPALQRAHRIGAKAISAGFKLSDRAGALDKLREELGELERELSARTPDAARVEAELGDVLLAAALLGNYVGIDPERAARAALRRFEARFRAMEAALGRPLRETPLSELLASWKAAKVEVVD
jgi:MazG family protein